MGRRKKYSRSEMRRFYISLMVLLLTFIGIGYAYLQQELSINGTTKISKNTWDVHFDNLTSTDNTKVSITNDTTVTLNVTLNPGDSFEYTVDAVNNGSIDAKIGSITPITVPSAYQSVIEYSLNYDSPAEGEVISVNDVLRSGTSEPIKFTIRYKGEDELDSDVEGATLNLNFTISYVQADSNITEVEHLQPVCKKATTLHTEICSLTSSQNYGCYAVGYRSGGAKGTTTITYGHTEGSTLTPGYALTCDVNGDGTYDEATERFYYVSDFYDTNTKSFNTDYATLIYYKSYGSSAVAYNSSNYNYQGPTTLLSSLPTTGTWKNISLVNEQRQILNQNGGNTTSGGTLPKFSYAGYAARPLTSQEVNSACNITVGSNTTGELDSCEFLMEDTYYSKASGCSGGTCTYGLETPYASDSTSVWGVLGSYRRVSDVIAASPKGSRPAIDVAKSDIRLN